MATNLELKTKVSSFQKVRDYLEKIGAYYKGTLQQRDIYYKHDKGLLKLRLENGKGQLILYNRDEINADRWSDYHILKIEDTEVEKFMEKIFTVETIVEKSRQLYIYNNTRIHLDRVKKLGSYLELETVVVEGKKNSKQEFDFIVENLHLDAAAGIKKSYKDLIESSNSI